MLPIPDIDSALQTLYFFFNHLSSKMSCHVQSFLPGGFWVVIGLIRECLGAGTQSQRAGVHTQEQPTTRGKGECVQPSCLAPGVGAATNVGTCAQPCPQLPSQVALYRPVNLLGDEASFGSFPFRPLPGAISQINYLLLNPYLGVCFWGNPNQDNIYTAWNRCSLSQW